MTHGSNDWEDINMAKVIVGMTTSLDGFVTDRSGNAGRLYPDLAALQGTAYA